MAGEAGKADSKSYTGLLSNVTTPKTDQEKERGELNPFAELRNPRLQSPSTLVWDECLEIQSFS